MDDIFNHKDPFSKNSPSATKNGDYNDKTASDEASLPLKLIIRKDEGYANTY